MSSADEFERRPDAGSPALSIRGLSAGYAGGEPVIREVALSVPQGSVTALLGPNGAGKTTLLRAVAGFVQPSEGQIEILGVDVTASKPAARFQRGLCLIPEGRGIFRSLSVRDNLIVQAPKGHEASAIDRAVEAFPVLGQRLGHLAGTLSGGEQQMLAVTAAHIRNPRVVMIDEASLGLAPVIVDEIFEFVARLADGGASLLLVDQFVERVLDVASQAFVLRRGSMVFSGPAADLKELDVFNLYVDSK